MVTWSTYGGRRRGIGRVLHTSDNYVRIQCGSQTITLNPDHDTVEELHA